MTNPPTSLMTTAFKPAASMVYGKGSYVWDENNRKYLDLIQGWAVNVLGHCPDEIINAVDSQVRKLITPSPAFHNEPQKALAERLCKLSGLDQTHLANSGAEANEAAVKLARKWGKLHKSGAYEIITTHNAFHGRTLCMMAASGKAGWDTLYPPQPPGFCKVNYGDIHELESAITDNTVAIMLEPVQGEAGVIVPPSGYLKAVRDLATKHHLLLILDEIQTGMGRTGHYFAYQAEDIRPDILTLGKGLGGGVPISAVVAAEHACVFQPGDQGGTYNGNPLMCAVANAIVAAVCTPEFMRQVNQATLKLDEQLSALHTQHRLAEIRGKGLLQAIEFDQPVAEKIRDIAMHNGLLINAPRPTTLRLMPALNITESEIEQAVYLLENAITAACT